ncbi:hypothetical protein SK128_026222 [Halocaridina rubra]|uniref:Uncharacterized protein n=1 Tax=Halocaridina rubra TaxID=373956 RepID=A0AAN9ABY7_HALRR
MKRIGLWPRSLGVAPRPNEDAEKKNLFRISHVHPLYVNTRACILVIPRLLVYLALMGIFLCFTERCLQNSVATMDLTKDMCFTYKVSEENEKMYQELCKDLLKSQSVFQYKLSKAEQLKSPVSSKEAETTGTNNQRTKQSRSPLFSREQHATTAINEIQFESDDDNIMLDKCLKARNDKPQPARSMIDKNAKVTRNKRKLSSDDESRNRYKSGDSMTENVLSGDSNNGNFRLKSIQKNFISSLNSLSTSDVKMPKFFDPSIVCKSAADELLIVNDDMLVQGCKKCEKLDDHTASLLGSLIILPKICHLPSKLPPSSCEALCDYIQCHPKTAINTTFVPFLRHCPLIQEQHRDLLVQVTENCASPVHAELLRALSSREIVCDVDLQIFQNLCLKVDCKLEKTHYDILSFLGSALKTHNSSVKFGQCLLFTVKQFGQYFTDLKALQGIVDGHSSGMKKAIEIQLRKILAKR